jgi:glycosyltransferase involved in cell wall biosynthesis
MSPKKNIKNIKRNASSKQKKEVREIPTYDLHEFAKKKTKYTVVIPIINEGEKFQKQIRELKPYSKKLDIIIADGGSTDGSTDKRFLKSQGVRALLVKTGEGKLGAQYRMAFSYAMDQGYEGIITMDGNGKDDADSLDHYIQTLDEGFDYIQGSRFIKGGKAINTPLMRLLAIRLLFSPMMTLASGYVYTDVTNGHRAYSRRLILHPKLKLFRNIFVKYEILFYITARAKKLGLKTKEIPVTRKYPDTGKTPTKIIGWKSQWELLSKTVAVALGKYNP